MKSFPINCKKEVNRCYLSRSSTKTVLQSGPIAILAMEID